MNTNLNMTMTRTNGNIGGNNGTNLGVINNAALQILLASKNATAVVSFEDETGWSWMDLTSDGSVQMGMQDNSRMDQGDAAYLGVVPEGVVLGISTDAGLNFVAAFKMDLYDNLTLTMIDGQNPFAEGETQLQMTRSYD